MASNKIERIESVSRAIKVVEAMAANGQSTLKELSECVGLSNAALIRIINTLEEHGWARRLLAESKYELSFKLSATLASKSLAHPLAELATPELVNLSKCVPWPSDIAVCRQLGQLSILESTRPRGPLFPLRTIYGANPSMLRTALGRAYLAHCPHAERQAHIDHVLKGADKAEKRLIESGDVDKILHEVKVRRYGIRDSAYWMAAAEPGPQLMAIAVPIMQDDSVFGALNLVWIDQVASVDEIVAEFLEPLERSARAIARLTAEKPTLARTFEFARQLE